MEIGKYTQGILQRIQKIEPDNAIKIFGYLLLHHNNDEIVDYLSGTEEQIHSLIAEAKSYFMFSSKFKFPHYLNPYYSHATPLPFFAPPSIRNLDHFPHKDACFMEEQLYTLRPMGVDLPHNLSIPGVSFGSLSHSLPSCREFPIEDHKFAPGLLENYELKIATLLRARRGVPVSVSLLPLLYQEMYGKALLTEGYLRPGKVGASLMKLLALLRNIRLVDGPHGDHWVVLDEDASNYMEFMTERNDLGNSSSHQIYLTFLADSTFTDIDVQNYFSQFGPVHDVRIPHQAKRMFGFVSFYHSQTVRQILEMGHPHNICGSRVLVKPYIEKSRLVQRKYAEKLNDDLHSPSLSFDLENGLSPRQNSIEASQFHKKQQIGLEEPNLLHDQFSSLSIASQEDTIDEDKSCNNQDSLMIQLPENPFASPRF
ncbi:zinc finger CCCH domain-containing protein 18-like isoform X2 [Phalaenopsis equestris]|uniref:zinc finger CCCH domain-containing protein 18-like isoform X2 n=1 Tax=Phalaenopsis equestris TaxID=78828 RepID=UPI0009E274EB|nr:zinc finger CCCH domain-containing protein 18-like isoform X2 [Phalaenopsis equestris]